MRSQQATNSQQVSMIPNLNPEVRQQVQKSNKVSLWYNSRSDSKSGKAWIYLDSYTHGRRKREALQLFCYTRPKNAQQRDHNRETKALAEETRTKRQLAVMAGEHDLDARFKADADFVEFFEVQSEKKHRLWATVVYHLKIFARGPVSFREIDEGWIEEFSDYLLEHVAKNTARTYLNKIKACLNIAVRHRIIRENPFRYVKPLNVPESEIKRSYLSEESLHKLVQTPCKDAEVKRAFLFACFVGLRLSDVIRLRWKDVDLADASLSIIQKKTKERVTISLHETALQLIGHPKSPETQIFAVPLWKNEHGGKAWEILKVWGKRAGIPEEISFHSSRRTFATRGITAGLDIYTVKELLGQTEIRSTQLYVKLVNSARRSAIDKLPGLELGPDLVTTNGNTETIKAEGEANA